VRSVLRLKGLPEDVSKDNDILPLFNKEFALAQILDPRAVAETLLAAGKTVAVTGQLDSALAGGTAAPNARRRRDERRGRRGGGRGANKGGKDEPAKEESAAVEADDNSAAPAAASGEGGEEGGAAGAGGAAEGDAAAIAAANAASSDPSIPQTADDISLHAGAVGCGNGATLTERIYLGIKTESNGYGKPNGESLQNAGNYDDECTKKRLALNGFLFFLRPFQATRT
jgi:hypothetical protein